MLAGDEDIGADHASIAHSLHQVVAQPFWKRRPYFDLWHYLPKTICSELFAEALHFLGVKRRNYGIGRWPTAGRPRCWLRLAPKARPDPPSYKDAFTTHIHQ